MMQIPNVENSAWQVRSTVEIFTISSVTEATECLGSNVDKD